MPPPPSVACMARASHSTAAAKQMRRASNRDDAPGGRVHYACDTNHMRSAPFRRPVQRSGPSCVSAFIIICRTPSLSVAACGGLHMSVLHPTCRTQAANARRRRVSHRAPALRPHRTGQILMRVQRAHNREGRFSDLFGPPKSIWWGLALAGLCSSAVRRGLAGQEGGGREEDGRRGGEGLFLPTLDGCGLRRTASDMCACVDCQQRFYSHTSALCRTPARAIARGRACDGAMGATACAFALL